MWHERIVRKTLQRYWRWQRALTLGARGMVVDGSGRLLLIRHTYTPGWTFPGGGVEWRETAEDALRRELHEEAGVELTGPPQLFGLYSNEAVFPGDHVALYLVRAWRQARPLMPTREIADARFFAPDGLPAEATAGARRRVAELLAGGPTSAAW